MQNKKSIIAIFSILATWSVAALFIFLLSKDGALWNNTPVVVLLAAIAFGVQWLVFLPSFFYQTEHYFDLTGSLTYITLMICCGTFLVPDLDTRSYILLGLVGLWAARLGSFLFLRVQKAKGDSRFVELKTNFWVFLMVWNLQGLWVLLTAIAALTAITSPNKVDLQLTGWVGIVVWILGFAFEVISDRQKTAFRAKPENKGKFIQSGLWARSRHPNYFGEILLWIGIAIIAFPTLQGWNIVALISPVFVTVLLTQISGIPLLERQGEERWGDDPEYQKYLQSTPVLIPRLL